MFEFQPIDIDMNEVSAKLQGTNIKLPAIIRKMTLAVNRQVIKQAKQNYKANFNSKNHSFNFPSLSILKSFKTKGSKKQKEATILKNGVFYSTVLENGAVINAKKSNYLIFKINGEFKKVKSVQIEAKPFLRPAVESYWNTTKYKPIVESVLERELEKYWGKNK